MFLQRGHTDGRGQLGGGSVEVRYGVDVWFGILIRLLTRYTVDYSY